MKVPENKSNNDTLTENNLAEGWVWSRVGDLLKINYGRGLKEEKRVDGPVPVYGSNGIVGQHNSALTEGPTIIIGRKGSIGAIHYSSRSCWPIDTTYFIDNFSGLNPLYLKYVFRTLNLGELDTSTAIPGVNRNELYEQRIPLAPLAEQRRIVEKVEELLAQVSKVRERLGKVRVILKRFRQAVLAAACSGRLTADWRDKQVHFEELEKIVQRIFRDRLMQYEESCKTANLTGQKRPRKPSNLKPQIRNPVTEMDVPPSWFWTSLKDLASIRQYAMSSGPFGSALGTKDYRNRGVPVIRGHNIQEGIFLLESLVYVSEEKASGLVRSSASPGDIVVVAVGSSGRAAIVPRDLPRAVLSQNCNKITVDKSLALAEFVLLFLQIEIAKDQLREKTTDTARPFLSLTNLKETLVPVAPLEEQQEIVRQVNGLFKLVDTIEKRLSTATTRAEKLTQAILAKAFKGELVPTEAELARREGLSYEPASVLLARISSEQKGKDLSETSRLNRRRQQSEILASKSR
jgi:type I restriction enzyme S subunit